MRKEEIASDDVSDDFITNMKINIDHIKSQTIDQNNEIFKEVDGELDIKQIPGEYVLDFAQRVLGFEEMPGIQIDLNRVRKKIYFV